MAGQRKLLSEIDRTLKKVSEGVDVFNEIWDKVYAATAQNQKEKHEADLKKEIKKLQRFRDQIKTWINNSDIKDKRPLVDTRKLIEQKMEEFKVCEKETKTKAYSKEGLAQVERLDPEQQARQQSHAWIQDCLNQFNVQIEALESDVERLHSAKGRNRNKAEIEEKEKLLSRHKWHILKLEQINRLLDNAALEPEQVDELKEDVDYFLEANQEPDFMDTYGDDDIYETLDLDTLGAAAQVALPTEQDVGIDDTSSAATTSAAATTSSGRGKTPRKSVTASVITGIGRAGAVKPIDLKSSTPSRSSSTTKSDTSPSNGIKTDDLKIGKGRTTPQRAKSGSSSSEKSSSKTPTPVPSSPAVGTPARKVSPPTPQRTPSPTVSKGQAVGTSSSSSSASPAAAKPPVPAPSPAPSNASLPPPLPAPSPTANTSVPVSVSAPVPAVSTAPTPTPAAKLRPLEESPQLTEEQKQVLRMIDESFHFVPESRDSEKANRYVPRNLYPTPASFPATPSTLFSSAPIFEKLDVDTLFFIFYYQQGSYQQYLAARELKRRTWGYHKKYKTWFKRHEEPQATGEDYEQGTFVYFDYETGWCQRIKTEFTFEYSYLEDELQ